MLQTLHEQFDVSTWVVGWTIAIIDAGIEFSAILASPLREKFGAKAVVTVSGALVGGSLIASSFASSLYQIGILLTLFCGPAIGVSTVVTKDVIGRSFSEFYTLAFGIGGIGGSLAFFTTVPLTQFFLDVYGWRGTMLLLGAILSHLAVCGALMKEPAAIKNKDEYQTVTVDEEQRDISDREPASNSRCRSCLNSVSTFISKNFGTSLLSSTSFWVMVFMLNIWMMMYTAWFIYFVPYAIVSKGFSQTDASVFLVCFGSGRFLGHATLSALVKQFHVIGNKGWLGIGLLMMSVYYALDPWLISYWPTCVGTFIFGYSFAIPVIQIDVVIIEIFGANQLGLVLGWNGLIAGVSRILSLYFPGLIYDTLGSYTLAFTLMGSVHSLTVVALLALVWLQRRRPSIP
ncbi:monocarboxylate transporter 12-like [Asterias amurensis]|uniref:monocarboxylate transporter 12-like n=1 Tax=Asterias amurensis TaxID=7602 RepID=UPI003AB37C9B